MSLLKFTAGLGILDQKREKISEFLEFETTKSGVIQTKIYIYPIPSITIKNLLSSTRILSMQKF